MLDNVPRISVGASGLGSNESMCVTPPAIHRMMTDFALPKPGIVDFGVSAPRAALLGNLFRDQLDRYFERI